MLHCPTKLRVFIRLQWSLLGGPMVGAMGQYVMSCYDAHSMSFAHVDFHKMAIAAVMTGFPVVLAHISRPPQACDANCKH